MSAEQVYFASQSHWRVSIERDWDVLGPFPIHAREQHFLSPSFPLNLSRIIDYNQSWPSSYADNGVVKWQKMTQKENGDLEIAFPDIRWSNLRSTEGWAALQHHAVLRTTVTVYPPSDSLSSKVFPQLLINVKYGSYFCMRPRFGHDVQTFTPKWYAGNIYDLERALPHVFVFPSTPSLEGPTQYDLFVSGDYEIRLFGDPLDYGSMMPIQKLNVDLKIRDTLLTAFHEASQDVICHFLAGYSFGDAIGIGVQSISGSWTAQAIELKSPTTGLKLRFKENTTISPTQTRILPIIIEQSYPCRDPTIDFDILLTSGNVTKTVSISLPIHHHEFGSTDRQWIQGTYFFANSMPTPFLAVLPKASTIQGLEPALPIIALHGAGVDVLAQEFWVNSLPDNKGSWMLIPTGRTSWGLDWHGPSTDDIWSSLEALTAISRKQVYGFPELFRLTSASRAIVLGHSNGGQGTWYIASRYPDRIIAAIPASAYIKSQSYIPLNLARSGHFMDPSLRVILESSLTPDDNDLHATNLVNIPILAIHGGVDTNVPTWHTREAVAIIKTWSPSANITYKEAEGEPHWYSNVFQNEHVQSFVDKIKQPFSGESDFEIFTLTVALPRRGTSLHGWNIDQLIIPGRLGRLTVRKLNASRFEVDAMNIRVFSIPPQPEDYTIIIEGLSMSFLSNTHSQIYRIEPGNWEAKEPSILLQTSTRMQSILSTPDVLTIVISTLEDAISLSAALRIAHVLHIYLRLDTNIVSEQTASTWRRLGRWPPGNIIFIGKPTSILAKDILDEGSTDIRLVDSIPHIGTRKFKKLGQALCFLHPHPEDKNAFMMFVIYNDEAGLERSLRLFPFRTGVAVPDWVVLGEGMDLLGAAGFEAAGVWGNGWTLNESMAWFAY